MEVILADVARRCVECGRPVAAEAATCSGCGAQLTAICACGATFSRHADECPKCRTPHDAVRYPSPWTARRIVLGTLVLLGLALGIAWGLRHRQRPRPWQDLAAADDALQGGRLAEAELLYARHIAEFGGSAQVHYARGVALHRLGRVPEAAQEMQRTLERSSLHVRAALYLASLSLSRGDGAGALALARQALAADPRAARGHLIAGHVLSTPGMLDLDRARWHLREAMAEKETRIEARVLLAEVLVQTARAPGGAPGTADSEEALRAAAEDVRERLLRDPDRNDLRLFLVRIAFALGDVEQAWVQLERIRGDAAHAPDTRSIEGRLLWLRGAEGEGKRALDEVLAANPGGIRVLEIAAFYESVGREDLSRATLRDAQDQHPNDLTLQLHETRVLLRDGRPEEAETRLLAARDRRPDEPLVTLWLVDALLAQRGRRAEAEELLREARRRAGVDPTISLRLADLLLDADAQSAVPSEARMEEARSILGGVQDLMPDSPTANYRLFVAGKLAVLERRFAEAVDNLSTVVERNPRDPYPHLLLARVHEECGDHDLATLELTAAMRSGGTTAELLERRARARLADPLGTPESARQDARAALELDPSRVQARVLLARALARGAGRNMGRAEIVLREGIEADTASALRLELARVLAATGRLEAAVAEAAAAHEEAHDDGEAVEALLLLAQLADESAGVRMSDAARALFETEIRAHPDDMERPLRYAELLLRAGDTAAAGDVVRPITRRPDGRTRAARILFETLVGADASLDAARDIAAALERDAPGTTEQLYVTGKLALREDRTEDAVDSLRRAAARSPLDTDVCYYLATALIRANELKEAQRLLERTIGARPRLLAPRLLLAEVAHRQGRAALRGGRYDLALESLHTSLARDRGHAGARAALVAAYIDMSAGAGRSELARARKECEQLVAAVGAEDTPRADAAIRLLCSIAAAQQDWEKVVETAQTLAARNPDDVETIGQQADALVVAGRAGEAVQVLEEALARMPGAWPLLRGLVDAHAAAGSPADGLRSARRWIDDYPADPRGPMVLGWLLMEGGRDAEAERSLTEALERDPHLQGAALALVDLLLRNGRADAAVAALQRLAERGADTPELRFQSGRALLAAGRADEGLDVALAAFRKGIQSDVQWAWCASILLEGLIRADRRKDVAEVALDSLERGRAITDPPARTPGAHWLADTYRLAGIGLQLCGEPVRAEHAYHRALDLRPDDAVVLNNLAELIAGDAARRNSRELDAAVTRARRAVDLVPEAPEYRDTLGFALAAAGHTDEAAEEFARALPVLRRRADERPGEDAPRRALAACLLRSTAAVLLLGRVEEAQTQLDEARSAWPDVAEQRAYHDLMRRARR